jgi:chitinase
MMWQWIPGGGECASLTRCSNPALLQLDVAAITRFVEDWGLDGVDIDFEAEAGEARAAEGAVPGLCRSGQHSTALPTC